MLRTFIEQEKLDVRMTRQTKNSDLIDMIEAAYSDAPNNEPEPEEEQVDEETGEGASRTGEEITQRRRR